MPKPSSRFPTITGCALFGVVLLVNEWTLTPYFSHSGTIGTPGLRRCIWLFDTVTLGLALILFLKGRETATIDFSKNILLLYATMAILLTMLHIAFPHILMHLPLSLRGSIREPFHLLCQTSKQGPVPRHYVAIFGDSYAQGYGDWLQESIKLKQKRFHSAHVLHDLLGRDILTFGQGGVGSIGGMVRKPLNALRILGYRFSMEAPEVILVYFYEGNDLKDNLKEIQLHPYFKEHPWEEMTRDDFYAFLDTIHRPTSRYEKYAGSLLAIQCLFDMVNGIMHPYTAQHEHQRQRDIKPWRTSKEYNRAKIDGRLVRLPDDLQGPCLELSGRERQQGLQIFAYTLAYMKTHFRHTPIVIVYIPSILSCYELTGSISTEVMGGRRHVYDAAQVTSASRAIAASVKAICAQNHIAFLDTRSALRATARDSIIHGPIDWYHLNERGYRLLAKIIVEYLDIQKIMKPSTT